MDTQEPSRHDYSKISISFFLKKGFQFFPPCLSYVLYLSDLGVTLKIYHGENTPFINDLLDARSIYHKTIFCEKKGHSRLVSLINFLRYTAAAKRIICFAPQSEVLWFGNCESVMTLSRVIKNRFFIFSALEMYEQRLYRYFISKFVHSCSLVTVCEPHRGIYLRRQWKLTCPIFVLPNKAYEMPLSKSLLTSNVQDLFIRISNFHCVVLYQGIIRSDRSLTTLAQALKEINDPSICLLILGSCTAKDQSELTSIYSRTIFGGFVPNPGHLLITKKATIGIANYDRLSLNNEYCAPNKIFEYARFGIPILCSENIGLQETVGRYHAGLCVDFGSTEAVKSGIITILHDLPYFSNCCKDLYLSFDNRETIDKILDFLSRDK